MTALLLPGFLLAYYGKERQNYFTPAEVQAATWIDANAPSGSRAAGTTPRSSSTTSGSRMVLADRWSWTVGAACLAGIAGLGFVPAHRLLSSLGLRIRWRLSARGISFTDWYAAYAERRRLAAEAAEAATLEWTDWYAEQQRLVDEAYARADEEWTAALSLPPAKTAESPKESG
jgi:hypothetical protein